MDSNAGMFGCSLADFLPADMSVIVGSASALGGLGLAAGCCDAEDTSSSVARRGPPPLTRAPAGPSGAA